MEKKWMINKTTGEVMEFVRSVEGTNTILLKGAHQDLLSVERESWEDYEHPKEELAKLFGAMSIEDLQAQLITLRKSRANSAVSQRASSERIAKPKLTEKEKAFDKFFQKLPTEQQDDILRKLLEK